MINDIKKTITSWLSNPINIRLAILFTYSMVLYMMYINFTMREFIFVSLMLSLGAFFVRLSGLARGMFMAMIEKETLESFMKEMRKLQKKNKRNKSKYYINDCLTPPDGEEVGPYEEWEKEK